MQAVALGSLRPTCTVFFQDFAQRGGGKCQLPKFKGGKYKV